MKYSYWEQKEWFNNNDFVIVGSGIVGLNCALQLKKKYPKSSVLILEKGMLPQGASTKNAGFACFGSVSELLDDLQSHTEEEVVALVQKRWDGLQVLRNTLGDTALDYQQNKGHELFVDNDFYDVCAEKIPYLNQLLAPIFNSEVYQVSSNIFGFHQIVPKYITINQEAQIDTGKMMASLLQKALGLGIKILNNVHVLGYTETNSQVAIETNQGVVKTNQLLFATNGFSKQLLEEEVMPARAQVLITKPIKDLHIKGTFHLDKGYYYFRNINNRILFGGGRNLDFKGEETTEFAQTKVIQDSLEDILAKVILPNTSFEIESRWSGIMGVGDQKKPIVKQLSNRVYCGIRLGGMGVAIGSLVGKELADLVE